MGFLISSRPNVDIAKAVVFPLPAKRTVGGPALYNQIVGFVKSLPRVGRIYLVREIFHAGTDDHARNNTPFGNHIEHGDFFRYPLRMIVKGQNVAQNHQFCLLCSPRQTSRHNVRRRHATVGGLMMFVDANSVETELIRQLQLVQVTVVERMTQLGIIECIWALHPGALM